MSVHVDVMRRAIEFGAPAYVPMDLVDVPFIYNAYGTMDEATVTVPPGAESFDSAWCTYHWTFEHLGKTQAGEPIRRDEWGCTQIVPQDESVAYSVVERPSLTTMAEVEAFPWPDPAVTDAFFAGRRRIIEQRYPDRFICGMLDPAPLVVAFELFGYEGLLLGLHDHPDVILAAMRRIVDYQLALVPRFADMGAHMVNVIDEVAGKQGLMFSPALFRRHFVPLYEELLAAIHKHGMYTSLLLDGNLAEIMPDLMRLDLDQMLFAQPHATGIDVIADYCRGKRCVKLAVDMMDTLAVGTPQEIEAEVDEMVAKLNTPRGGLVFQAMRWHRPEYAAHRVQAQITAMNRYRQGA